MESKISAGFIYEIKSEHVRKRGKIITGIISQASSIVCWIYVQKYVKHKTINEMLQELPDVGQFILAMDTWFEKLMGK